MTGEEERGNKADLKWVRPTPSLILTHTRIMQTCYFKNSMPCHACSRLPSTMVLEKTGQVGF